MRFKIGAILPQIVTAGTVTRRAVEPTWLTASNPMVRLIAIFSRFGSRTTAKSKVELFVMIVNGFQPLTVITKSSTLDVAVVLDPSLFSVRGNTGPR